jgi:hypothetical protein
MREKAGPDLNWVTAVFEDAALSFDLAREATPAQLAEQLGILGQVDGGLIHVRVSPKKRTAATALGGFCPWRQFVEDPRL